ncbi:hypothetical protein LINGRAHAP2_LOCUS17405 [Linum grandiflorum]
MGSGFLSRGCLS